MAKRRDVDKKAKHFGQTFLEFDGANAWGAMGKRRESSKRSWGGVIIEAREGEKMKNEDKKKLAGVASAALMKMKGFKGIRGYATWKKSS